MPVAGGGCAQACNAQAAVATGSLLGGRPRCGAGGQPRGADRVPDRGRAKPSSPFLAEPVGRTAGPEGPEPGGTRWRIARQRPRAANLPGRLPRSRRTKVPPLARSSGIWRMVTAHPAPSRLRAWCPGSMPAIGSQSGTPFAAFLLFICHPSAGILGTSSMLGGRLLGAGGRSARRRQGGASTRAHPLERM